MEIGWTFLARSHWGGRFNKELKWLLLGHAFLFVESVIFFAGVSNFRSQKALAKIGAVNEGEAQNSAGVPSIKFGIRREQYLKSL